MKTLSNIAIYVFIILCVLSCKKNEVIRSSGGPSKEIAEIALRDSGEKSDEEIDDTLPKIEVSETDASVLNSLQSNTLANFSQDVSSGSLALLAGVIKPKGISCNGDELTVFMDAEDHNNNSDAIGWIGDCYKTSRGNIGLSFCIIDASYLYRMARDYAVLKISPDNIWGVGNFAAHIDNEDCNNRNHTEFNGTPIYPNGTSSVGPNAFDDNTTLYFYYFERDPGFPPGNFPIINASITNKYGVFGRFQNTGYIYMDDEDGKLSFPCYHGPNTNYMIVQRWDDGQNLLGTPYVSSGVPFVVDMGSTMRNTKFYTQQAF